MSSIKACSPPDKALLNKYVVGDAYTDCYRVEILGTVTQAQYIAAFYTTPVFKLERTILKWIVSKPSVDSQVEQLANGTIDEFAAWHVEARSENQLLLCDFRGRTRSWLMTLPMENQDTKRTHLYFGSAVVPVHHPKTGKMTMGLVFKILLSFHRLYSKVLLHSAKKRLIMQAR